MSAKLLLITLVISVTPVVGQTAAEIEEAYGKPTLAYSVSESAFSELLLRKGEFKFTIPFKPVIKDRLPSQDDFLQTNDMEIATIRWLRRKCVGL